MHQTLLEACKVKAEAVWPPLGHPSATPRPTPGTSLPKKHHKKPCRKVESSKLPDEVVEVIVIYSLWKLKHKNHKQACMISKPVLTDR